jgi:hypothetical protein
VCPALLWSCVDGVRQLKWKAKTNAPFAFFCADIASKAYFWWLGALSKRNRALDLPLDKPSKMLIAELTWVGSSSAPKYPLQFLPALKTIQASLKIKVNETRREEGKVVMDKLFTIT